MNEHDYDGVDVDVDVDVDDVKVMDVDTNDSPQRSAATKPTVVIVFKKNKYWIESKDPHILQTLLQDPTIARAKEPLFVEECKQQPFSKVRWNSKGEVETIDDDSSDDDDDYDDDDAMEGRMVRFQLKDEEGLVEKVKEKSAQVLGYPLLEEYDYKSDNHQNSNTKIPGLYLKPKAHIRSYQERALSAMLGNDRAKSGMIVLPCGAGKTLTGIVAAQTIRRSVLVLAPNATSVLQWKAQFQLWTHIPQDRIAIFTSNQKDPIPDENKACVLIATYQMIAFGGKRATAAQQFMDTTINGRMWGLLLLDEAHVVPAQQYRKAVQSINARCRLGLTATLVREDDLIKDLNYIIGPILYEANWLDLTAQGYLAKVQCVEVWCPMTTLFMEEYRKVALSNTQQQRRQSELLYILNPNKLRTVEFLVRFHEARGDKIIVFSDSLFSLHIYAKMLQRPYMYGDTKEWERQAVLSTFRRPTNEVQTICLSQVGDAAIDLPSANIIIQVSSHYGARQQEAQRLGRILRPKSSPSSSGDCSSSSFHGYFYSLITPDTQEMSYSAKRQQYLIGQGYTYKVVKNLWEEANSKAIPEGYAYLGYDDDQKLLGEILKEMG